MNDFTLGALAGSAISLAWSKLQQLFTWVTSLLIVRVEIQASSFSEAAEWYCWSRLRHTRSPFYKFECLHTWVRSSDRQEPVIVERAGTRPKVFWDGWRPLLFSGTGGASSGSPQTVSAPVSSEKSIQLSFVRGTFAPDQLMRKIMDAFHAYVSTQSDGMRRFRVLRYAGLGAFRHGPGSDSRSPAGMPPTVSNTMLAYGRVVGYELSDLGDPLVSGAPLERLAMSTEVTAAISDIRRWAKSRAWYRERQIPWRRGMLLHGPSGTGKSSLVRALAQELDWPICVFDLATMSNKELMDYWTNVGYNVPAVVLVEDIDAIFNGRTNVVGDQGGGLTFDCLLNTLSGVAPADGLLVILTTNNRQTLDAALAGGTVVGPTRPGRIDLVVEMGPPDLEGRRLIARNILADQPLAAERLVQECAGQSGAQFQERCISEALAHYWNTTVPSKLAYRGWDPCTPDTYTGGKFWQPPLVVPQPLPDGHLPSGQLSA